MQGVQPTLLEKFFNGIIWRSEKKDEEGEGKGRKIPAGFEKLLRRVNKPIKHKDEEKSASTKEDKEAKKDKDEKEAEESEDEADHTQSKKTEESKKKPSGSNESLRSYFMEPNGGGPIWENILLAALLTGTFLYSVSFAKPASEEITYMDFV